jgi:hypothetical protein
MPSAVRKAGEAADAALKALQDNAESAQQRDSERNPGEVAPPEGYQTPGEGTPDGDNRQPLGWEEEFKKLSARFSVLQGKYNAEVPVLHAQIKEKDAEIARLQAGKPPEGSQVEFKPNASETELIDLYGEDFVKYVKAEAGKIVSDELGPLRERFEQMDAASTESVKKGFYEQLQEAHPDWESINLMESWLAFLGEVEPNSGLTRQEIISRAEERGDAEPVIRQLSAFKGQNKSGDQRFTATAVPGDTGGAPRRDTDERIYSASEIRQFYKDVTDGRYRGKEDEAARLEAAFAVAHKEGRINESV